MNAKPNDTHKGVNFVSVSHSEQIPSWGSLLSGGVYRRVQFMNGPDSETFTIETVVAHTGRNSDGLEVKFKVELNTDQLDEIMRTLEEIRSTHTRAAQERAAWKTLKDYSKESGE